jgi:hypothetical protein
MKKLLFTCFIVLGLVSAGNAQTSGTSARQSRKVEAKVPGETVAQRRMRIVLANKAAWRKGKGNSNAGKAGTAAPKELLTDKLDTGSKPKTSN